MVYFNGIDIISGRITLDFDYDKKQEKEVIKFARERLGEDVTINELSTFIEELQVELWCDNLINWLRMNKTNNNHNFY